MTLTRRSFLAGAAAGSITVFARSLRAADYAYFLSESRAKALIVHSSLYPEIAPVLGGQLIVGDREIPVALAQLAQSGGGLGGLAEEVHELSLRQTGLRQAFLKQRAPRERFLSAPLIQPPPAALDIALPIGSDLPGPVRLAHPLDPLDERGGTAPGRHG